MVQALVMAVCPSSTTILLKVEEHQLAVLLQAGSTVAEFAKVVWYRGSSFPGLFLASTLVWPEIRRSLLCLECRDYTQVPSQRRSINHFWAA